MTQKETLLRIEGLIEAMRVLEREVEAAVSDAVRQGADRTALAAALGVHRSTLYRRPALSARGGQGRPQAGGANP